MEQNYLTVVFCTDDNYVLPTMVAMQSLKLYSGKNKIKVFVFHSGLSFENTQKFKSMETEKFFVDFKDVSIYLKQFNLYKTELYPISIYYRFFIPELLKNEEKVLYLDCDVLVKKDIKSLFDIDLSNNLIAAVKDCNVFLGDETNLDYINSGVILYNIKECINFDFSNKCTIYIENNLNLTCPDQDAINDVCKSKTVFLSPKYNFHTVFCYDYKNVKINNKIGLKLFGLDNKRQIYIYHYAGEGIKPWEIKEAPFSRLWWKVAKTFSDSIYQEIKDFSVSKRNSLILKYSKSKKFNPLIWYHLKNKKERLKFRIKQMLKKH